MQALTIILLCLISIIAFCAETPVQMATLRWSGDGEFMSWRWEKLDEAFPVSFGADPLQSPLQSEGLARDELLQRQEARLRHVRGGGERMSRKYCGFPSRRWAAFFLGVLIGTVVVGCSMFGPGLGVSVY